MIDKKQTCSNCKHFKTSVTYIKGFGSCKVIGHDFESYDEPNTENLYADYQDGGNTVLIGKDFGCIHWTYIRSEKNERE